MKELMVSNQILETIKNFKQIVLVGHKNIDGDCLGSMLAFRKMLTEKGKKVVLVSKDEPNQNLKFLPNIPKINHKLPEKLDLIIALDCANLSQTGFPKELSEKKIINIDHHATGDSFGDLNLINSKAASCTQIIFSLFRKWGIKIDREIANYLLIGILTDTGGFQYSNTTQEVLNSASDLLKYGVNLELIHKKLFGTKSFPALKIWGKVLERIRKNNKYNIAASYVTTKDLEESGATDSDLEGISNFMSDIPQVSAVLFLSEKEGVVKGSLRTTKDNIDVSALASIMGGGGHKKAAGFSVPGELKIENGKIIVDVK